MAPKRRSELGRELPDNVYFATAKGRVYFRFKHPVTGQVTSLGPDLETAKAEGRRLNQDLAAAYGAAVRADMRMRGRDRNVAAVLDRAWTEYFARRGWSKNHLREVRTLLDHYRERWGRFSLRDVTTRVLSEQLEQLGPHARAKHRQFWIHVFRYAVARGLVADNAAERTLAPTDRELTRRTQRWTLEAFTKLREEADPALRIALDIALYSLQRRGDLVQLPKTAVHRPKDPALPWTLRVSPGKSRRRQLHLEIEAPPGSGLRSALQAAMAFEAPSPFLLARVPLRRRHGATKEHWTQWTAGTLTKAVSKLRDRLELFSELEPAERPGLHQLRALGSHLYEDQGYPDAYVQALMGHATVAMTKSYQGGHDEEIEWIRVEAGLRD